MFVRSKNVQFLLGVKQRKQISHGKTNTIQHVKLFTSIQQLNPDEQLNLLIFYLFSSHSLHLYFRLPTKGNNFSYKVSVSVIAFLSDQRMWMTSTQLVDGILLSGESVQLSMPKQQQSWVRSQHPPAQWNLRAADNPENLTVQLLTSLLAVPISEVCFWSTKCQFMRAIQIG